MPAPLSGPGRADLHLGQGRTLRPDTLMQTAQIRAQKPLADGAGHTLTAPFAVWLSMIAVVGGPPSPEPRHRERGGCAPAFRPSPTGPDSPRRCCAVASP